MQPRSGIDSYVPQLHIDVPPIASSAIASKKNHFI